MYSVFHEVSEITK